MGQVSSLESVHDGGDGAILGKSKAECNLYRRVEIKASADVVVVSPHVPICLPVLMQWSLSL